MVLPEQTVQTPDKMLCSMWHFISSYECLLHERILHLNLTVCLFGIGSLAEIAKSNL